jgi:molybdate transport system substrate-binding protein
MLAYHASKLLYNMQSICHKPPLMRNPNVRCLHRAALAFTLLLTSHFVKAETLEIYAAGSLRSVLEALKSDFRIPEGVEIKFSFGPSGKLRERIEAADTTSVASRPALFFSASVDHPQALVQSARMAKSVSWVRNSLCLVARPGVSLQGRALADIMLDATVKLGTSTPGADPAGDYTWQMFRKLDAIKPGAYAALDAKALKLVGASVNASQTQAPYAALLSEGKADVFVTYCTNAAEAANKVSGITWQAMPDEIDVAATYGIAIAANAAPLAMDFLRYVQGGRARNMLVKYGFGLPAEGCDEIDAFLQPALSAWRDKPISLLSAKDTANATPLSPMQHAQIALSPDAQLSFARAASSSSGAAAYGGALSLPSLAPGHYEILLNRRAWVDLVDAQGKALASVRSERWLSCAGVNKNIGFVVPTAGTHSLRLSQVEGDRVELLVAPLAPIQK